MAATIKKINNTKKLENTILASIVLFVFKLVFFSSDSLIINIINEFVILGTIYLWIDYVIGFVKPRTSTPLSIILNTGILTAIIFFILSVSTSFLSTEIFTNGETDYIYIIFANLLIFVFIGCVTYIFAAFKELSFYRQKTDKSKYFNTLVFFIIITGLSKSITKIDPTLDFIENAFFVVTILLIGINSIRVSWIAFLIKKQKVYLLVIAIVLSILFGFNYSLTIGDGVINQLLYAYSPGLVAFLGLLMIYGSIYFGVIFFTTLFHLPTAEAFDRKAEEVSSLMDLSKLITQVFDFKELADTVTSVTTKVCNSDSAWLVTKREDDFELSSVSNIGFVEADKITTSLLEHHSYNLNEVVTINDSPIKIRIKNDVRTFNFKAIAVAPLKVHNKNSGFLFVARKRDFSFDEDDIKAISAFADYAAVALENAKLIEESLEKERLEKELDVAREVQYKILPDGVPKIENLEISALFVPAFEVGGDYYDFFEISDNKLGFVIADVSGKGIQAAFIMAEIKGVFESLSRIITSPSELLIKVNEILIKSLEKKSFVTAVYGVIDTKSGKVNFSRAGHNSIMLCSKGKVEHFTPPGMGLGLDSGDKFRLVIKEMEIQLDNNDIIILYTDGIPESQNSKYEEFGYKKFEKILIENCDEEVNKISNEIMKAVTIYSQDKSQHDDITLVIFKWKFNNKKSGEV
ncbi:MAG: SpoIIE family protein phosphatase [Bacteroidetes bacterium]|nr:SpoIIE family protein phosphatase [Bacteroidota bacterium]